jgi:hypothetical protein
MAKNTYEIIVETYPELLEIPRAFYDLIELQDDSDGQGIWIVFWKYDKPLPAGLKVGK